MATIIDKLFPKNQADAIRKLWADQTSRLLLEQEIGKKLISGETVLDKFPFTQLMLITSLSPFSNSEEESAIVASIIYWGIKERDILPMVAEHHGKELAYRCLVSLGMFKKALIVRWKRYAAPSPVFYRNVGIRSFSQIGMEDISNHFQRWENFMSEIFL